MEISDVVVINMRRKSVATKSFMVPGTSKFLPIIWEDREAKWYILLKNLNNCCNWLDSIRVVYSKRKFTLSTADLVGFANDVSVYFHGSSLLNKVCRKSVASWNWNFGTLSSTLRVKSCFCRRLLS